MESPSPMKLDIKNITWIIYGLWVGGFLIHFLPLIAIIVLFIKRKDAAGTMYASHFEWILRTFAISMAVAVVMIILGAGLGMMGIVPFIAIPLGLWGLYRLVKGVLRLAENRAIENPKAIL